MDKSTNVLIVDDYKTMLRIIRNRICSTRSEDGLAL